MKRFFFFVTAVALVLTGCQSSTPMPTPAATTPTTLPAAAATEPALSYVEVFREGESSQIPVEIVDGTVGSYTIAMDPEYFTFYPQETVDMFSYDGWDGLPGVFYAVSDYADDATAQEFIDNAVAQFSPQYASYAVEETTVGNFAATAVCFSDYKEDPAYQYHLFLVNCQGNLYLFEAGFVFEMYEGLYAIMRACFDTFSPAP